MDIFSERLKELRQELGLSINQLAKQVGLPSSSICRWENKQSEVKGYQLVILAKFFKVSVDYLLGLDN